MSPFTESHFPQRALCTSYPMGTNETRTQYLGYSNTSKYLLSKLFLFRSMPVSMHTGIPRPGFTVHNRVRPWTIDACALYCFCYHCGWPIALHSQRLWAVWVCPPATGCHTNPNVIPNMLVNLLDTDKMPLRWVSDGTSDIYSSLATAS